MRKAQPGDYPGDDSYLYPYSYNDEPSERAKEINAFVSYLNSIARALLKGYEPPEHIDADEDEKETEERVWRLQRRAALPPELVYYIFELAQITSPYPSMTINYPPPQESTQASSSSSTTGQTHPPAHAFPNPPLSLLNQWTFPHPPQHQPTHFLHPHANANNSQNPNFVVRSTFGSAARKIWFVSPSLSRMDVRKITRVQLFTVSRDQGWVSNSRDGSWSWWEVGVVRDPGEDGEVREGDSSSQSSPPSAATTPATPTSPTSNQFTLPPEGQGHLSHFNPLASRNLEHCVGKPFNLTHPLLEELRDESEELARLGASSSSSQSSHGEEGESRGKERGVRLAVIGCAHFPGWMCVGSEAKLVIWERFVPDLGGAGSR